MTKHVPLPAPDTVKSHYAPGAGMVAAYERYFRSGVYDERYPRANPWVLSRIRKLLPEGGHVIDYGCGSGRYLFALRGHAGKAAGFDVSPAALDLLSTRADEARWPDLGVLGPDPEALDSHCAAHGPADLVLCLFGVLGHMRCRAEREAALRRMAGLLRPGSGRLILSVPNRWRRFYAEQLRTGTDGAIRYTRALRDAPLQMHYQLYGPARVRAELAAAGLYLEALRAESVFGESLLTRNGLARRVDRVVAPVLPAAAGYGLLAVAAPMAGSTTGPITEQITGDAS